MQSALMDATSCSAACYPMCRMRYAHIGALAATQSSCFLAYLMGMASSGRAAPNLLRDKVPSNLLASPSFASNPVDSFRAAMTQCNQQLHISSIDDTMSGTTAIACLVRGRTLHVANVGDSRWAWTLILWSAMLPAGGAH